METIRPERNDSPLQTRRSEGASPGAPAAMARFAALALALLAAGALIVLLTD